ncbi:MAG TPA: choice-of-anchor Q domain-containing protein [bacterium]|nr:choice-of-anchor Q domain-containing protein [bacterium]
MKAGLFPFLTAFFALFAALTSNARAAVFDVTTAVDEADGSCADGDCSLRDAILAANSSGEPDNIVNLPNGTYSLTLADAGEEDAGLIGDLDVLSNSLTINGNGSTIDASPLANQRIFDVVATGGLALVLNDLVLTGGTAQAGGAIRFDGEGPAESLVLNRCWVTGNHTSLASGGGINASDAEVIINDSTFSSNDAVLLGGGIFIAAVNLEITNSTISGNESGQDGGGIYAEDSFALLFNATIADNQAGDRGGGIFQSGFAIAVGYVLSNSILAGNRAVSGAQDCARDPANASIASSGFNVMGGVEDCGISPPPAPGVDQIVSDPLLGPLAENGGPTPTHSLLAGSPAIDGGDPDGCADRMGNALVADQRGFARAADGDGDGAVVCDAGSLEVVCGDGILMGGEECEDGNSQDGDCCDSACRFEASGSACNDDDPGTIEDQCDGAGLCSGTDEPMGPSGGGCSLTLR